jgi:hypothetical protein
MSVTAGLIRYPAEIYGLMKAAGTFYPPFGRDIQHCFLDRSWDELHPALCAFGAPLNRALSGDYGHDGGLDRFAWVDAGESDHYIGLVSPPLVAAISQRLNGLTFQQVAERISDASRGSDYLAPHFDGLVAIYAAAAAAGDCLFIHVA